MRCNYCGCVYVARGSQREQLGFLDDGMMGPGWHSRRYP